VGTKKMGMKCGWGHTRWRWSRNRDIPLGNRVGKEKISWQWGGNGNDL